MAATTRNSTLYASRDSSKYVQDARDLGGPLRRIKFKHTVVSGETGGASAGVQDLVNLCVLPANCEVVSMAFVSDAIWASAGTNGTLQIGDSGDDDRYMIATELYTAAGSPITGDAKAVGQLAFAGAQYRPTADTIVYATWKTANPVVGKIFKGHFLVVMAVG
jgi:hypothetical protein